LSEDPFFRRTLRPLIEKHLASAKASHAHFLEEVRALVPSVAFPREARQSRDDGLYPRVRSMRDIIPTVGWVVVGLALLVSFGIDLGNTARGGAVDLRNRITGVRLLEHGIDAYHYIWHEGDPPEYCDLRNNPNLPVSKTTVTPALLILHLPLAALPYRLAQFTWLFAQWLLLLGTAWLWLRAGATPLTGWLVALFVTGFSYTQAWRWEAERGQAYVPLVFLFAYWLTATMDLKRSTGFLTGCVAGFLIALRPPFVLLLPFLTLHRRGQLIGATAGLLLGLGLPLLMNPPIWADYFSAMQTHSELYRHGINPSRGPQSFPPTIEGTPTAILSQLAPFRYGDFSAHALLRRLGFGPFPELPLLFAVAAPFAFWLWLSRGQSVERLLPGLAAWIFLADLFLPTTRYSYYDVIILNVVFAGVVTAKKFPWAAWPCALALPLDWAVYAFSTAPPLVLNLPAFFFTLGAVLSLMPGPGGKTCDNR
jgi:hypothetical protein